jgi:RNA polymerase sigma factor (sigma-70 family)
LTKEEKEQVIIEWWDKNYKQLQINVHKVCGYSLAAISKWGSDIIPYVYESFRKMPLDKQYDIIVNGNPENYVTRSMALSIKSSTSMFYHTYRKFSRKSDEVSLNRHDKPFESTWELREQQIAKVREAMQDLDYYDKYLVSEYYIQGNTAKHIAEKTGISSATIGKSLKKALKKLKILLEDKYDIEF